MATKSALSVRRIPSRDTGISSTDLSGDLGIGYGLHPRLKTTVQLSLLALWIAGCTPAAQPTAPLSTHTYDMTGETAIVEIPLTGPVSERKAEVSGLAWYGDQLIILPQYPDRFGDNIFALSKGDILGYLDGTIEGPLLPRTIPLNGPVPKQLVPGFEGFEAVGFDGDQAFLTIEVTNRGVSGAYLIDAYMSPDLSALTIDGTIVESLPQPVLSRNSSDEALLVVGDSVITMFEVNGPGINPAPKARRFDSALSPAGMIEFPQVSYRITDVTAIDDDGFFWALNYNFPGDDSPDMILPDALSTKYGQGTSHSRSKNVERIIQLRYTGEAIVTTETAPIQLQLRADGQGRNWEGIVRLEGRGFLIMTDKYPSTILGFVPYGPSSTPGDDATTSEQMR